VRSIAPTILFEGPGALRNARQELDSTAAFGRGFLILLSLAVAALARKKDLLPEVRIGLLTSGLLFALIFVLGCFNTNLFSTAPSAYLIPSGLIFAFLGFLTLMMSVLFLSDAQLVVLTRREFAAYLYSPIGYIVLIGTSLVAAYGYWSFLDQMIPSEATLAELQQLKREITIPEPILTRYNAAGIVAVFQVLFLVPALTMRTFSEEKRTGTLEMLLTAPILEWKIVVSKFLAAWAFYILSFAPIGLYLIALWVVGERPFDYRPMMSYYIAVAAYGASFLGIGLFLSSLTKNQIVAAVLMFAVMIGMLLTFWLRGSQSTLFGPGVRAILEQFDFLSTWYASLSGTLPVRTMMLQASLAAFWLFVTTKVLEIRKWG
jgi:ABC-type transport system involved in multi-copper enzyme maturation permease subunit